MRADRTLPLLALLLLAACQTPPPAPAPPPPPEPVACPEPPPPPQVEELAAALAYAETLRQALEQGRGGVEAAQAAASAPPPRAEALQPLATLIALRLAEQRRLQDGLDKAAQQLRDSQRRNEQLNEKLEALKAIEQTLPVKPR